MCNLCGDHSFWSGAKCPRCGSTDTKDIGRIVG
jgi:Zn ribbon nucleic-acid-binding protein